MAKFLILLAVVSSVVLVNGQGYGNRNSTSATGNNGAMADDPGVRGGTPCKKEGFWAKNNVGEQCLCERPLQRTKRHSQMGFHNGGSRFPSNSGNRFPSSNSNRFPNPNSNSANFRTGFVWNCNSIKGVNVGNSGFGLGLGAGFNNGADNNDDGDDEDETNAGN